MVLGTLEVHAVDVERLAKPGVPPNTLSSQLNILSNAGLIEGNRQGRSIIYTANYDAISGLIVFLMEDCCQGREEVCSPIMAAAQSACC